MLVELKVNQGHFELSLA